jgi:hypothetical protein
MRIVEAQFAFEPAFPMPKAALWIWQGAEIKGSATIDGHPYGTECPAVPDITYDLSCPEGNPNCISSSGSPDFGDDSDNDGNNLDIAESEVKFLPSVVKNNLTKIADYVGPWSTEVEDMLSNSCSIDGGVTVIIEGDMTLNNSAVDEGCGVLFIDGDLHVNGNTTWHGVLMSSGATFVANGTCDIDGALVTGETTQVEISGHANITYNCELVQSLYNSRSSFKRMWWREIMPKITVMPNGTTIRR